MPYFTKKQLVLASKLGKKWGFNRQLSNAVNHLPDGEYPVTQNFEHFHKAGVPCERHIRCEIDVLGTVAFCDVTEEFFKQLPTNQESEPKVSLPTEIQFHESVADPTEAIRQFGQLGFFMGLAAVKQAFSMLKNGDLLFLVLPRKQAIQSGFIFKTNAQFAAMACHAQSDEAKGWMEQVSSWHRIGKDHKALDLPAEFSKAHFAIA